VNFAQAVELAVGEYPIFSLQSLCVLTTSYVTDRGVANALCAKLRAAAAAGGSGRLEAQAGALRAYVQQLDAQTGKRILNEDAAVLLDILRVVQ